MSISLFNFCSLLLSIRAVSLGLLDIVKFMLSNSKNQPLHNLCDKLTPLLIASKNKFYEIAKVLVQHSPNLVFVSDADGKIPLHEACLKGSMNIFNLLLDTIKDFSGKPVNLDYLDNIKRTPLYNACYCGNFDMVRRLIDFQQEHNSSVSLNVNITVKKYKRTPLHAAAQSGNLDIVHFLLSDKFKNIKINVMGHPSQRTLIKLIENYRSKVGPIPKSTEVDEKVASHDSSAIVKQPESSIGPKKRRLTDAENISVFENSISGEFNFSVGNEFNSILITPLVEAIACGNFEIAKLLLQHGACDSTGLACRMASFLEQHDLIKWILSYHLTAETQVAESSFELKWNDLKLPQCNGEWLSSVAEYHPPGKNLTIRFGNISAVHMEGNQLAEVPIELFQLQNVKKINISSNKLVSLPFSSDASSYQIPGGGWACCDLVELNLSSNKLKHLPACVWQLPSIEKLLCSKNKLATLLPEDRQVPQGSLLLAKKLINVELSSNSLCDVPPFFFELPNLKVVNLSRNVLTSLPETLWKCGTLLELDLSNNKLDELPLCQPEKTYRASFSYHNIGSRFMQHTQLQEGQEKISASSFEDSTQEYTVFSIRSLTIDQENRVRSKSYVQRFDYSNLSTLNLSSNKFSNFPEALACFAPNLTNLDISSNELENIDIHLLPQQIMKLCAKKCEITRIGTVLLKSDITNMKQNCRYFSYRGRTCQHRNHSQLQYLHTLDLSENRITYMQLLIHNHPEQGNQNLGESEVYCTKISVFDLLYPNLKNLNLTKNSLLKKFNPNIGHQRQLKSIKFDGNKDLEEIPMEFANFKNSKGFTELSIKDGLPRLKDPPLEYRSAALSNLLTFMKARLKRLKTADCVYMQIIYHVISIGQTIIAASSYSLLAMEREARLLC